MAPETNPSLCGVPGQFCGVEALAVEIPQQAGITPSSLAKQILSAGSGFFSCGVRLQKLGAQWTRIEPFSVCSDLEKQEWPLVFIAKAFNLGRRILGVRGADVQETRALRFCSEPVQDSVGPDTNAVLWEHAAFLGSTLIIFKQQAPVRNDLWTCAHQRTCRHAKAQLYTRMRLHDFQRRRFESMNGKKPENAKGRGLGMSLGIPRVAV